MGNSGEPSLPDPKIPATLPVFPLPNLVLFPQVVQALYIFEPRYREMLRDVLDSDRTFAMGILKPGWQDRPYAVPEIASTVCVCRVCRCHRRGDGTSNILVVGMARARVIEEVSQEGKAYRRIRVVREIEPAEVRTGQLCRKLIACCERKLADHPQTGSLWREWVRASLPLASLTDLLSYSLPLDLDWKLRLLEEYDASRRARMLISLLDSTPGDAELVHSRPEMGNELFSVN